MKIRERIKSLFRRQPTTAEELAARAEAESAREQLRQDLAVLESEIDARRMVDNLGPPF